MLTELVTFLGTVSGLLNNFTANACQRKKEWLQYHFLEFYFAIFTFSYMCMY
jgi:hypothetical protein